MTLSRLTRIIVAVLLTAIVVWRADPAQVLRVAAGANWWWVGAALLLVIVDRALNAYRWIELLCALTPGSRPPFGTVLRIFFISTFIGGFLPSVAGDVYRAYSLSTHDVRPAESAASVLMDRVLGVLAMVLLAVAALFLMPRFATNRGIALSLAMAGTGCAVAATVVFSSRAAALVQRWAGLLPGRLQGILSSLTDAVRRYAQHHGALFRVLAVSVTVQILRVIQAFLLGAALGIPLGIAPYFAFIPIIVLIMQLPVTVSGLGTSQLAFAWLFSLAGVASAEAVALSILFIALGFAGNLPGAILYALGDSRRTWQP